MRVTEVVEATEMIITRGCYSHFGNQVVKVKSCTKTNGGVAVVMTNTAATW